MLLRVVGQVLIELHGITAKNSDTHVNQIFNGFMDNGYAIFHKEPNTQGCKVHTYI